MTPRTYGLDSGQMRAQRALNRGLEAMGRRGRPIQTPTYEAGDASGFRAYSEGEQRLTLELLEGGRELVERGVELERQAEAAKRAGVEVLRFARGGSHHEPGTRHGGEHGRDFPRGAEPWAAIAELLGMASAQGAHKRYRDVEGPEPQAELPFDAPAPA